MLNHLRDQLTSQDFMPHGMCFLWRPELIWLHAISDGLIALAYYSIPFALTSFVIRRTDLVFPGIFLLFGLFIMACGTTHIMAIWTLWYPDYWVDGGIKVVTAAASLITAGLVWRIMPQALAIPSRSQLEIANVALAGQIRERERAEAEVRALNAKLEARVQARTADLEAANLCLRAALEEKEVLLREVHHRVKNNLQVVAGLLTLQARHAGAEHMNLFQDSLERIHAMGRVHEQLYRSEDSSTLDLVGCITGISEDLGRIYGSAASVRCRIEARGPVRVPLETATPLALIVNEVVSNARKHGFPGGREGEIVVRLDQRNGECRIEVHDDGIGLPPGFADGGHPSMGVKLIGMLARQLGATMSFQSDAGTRFILVVPDISAQRAASAR